MKYKGPGKHNIEDLEQIIDDMMEEYYDKDKSELFRLNKMETLVREIYQSCKTIKNNKKIDNLKLYLEKFGKDNYFNLNK